MQGLSKKVILSLDDILMDNMMQIMCLSKGSYLLKNSHKPIAPLPPYANIPVEHPPFDKRLP